MRKIADLHLHTFFSDGTFSPERIVEYSRAKGLDAIAITDHDCCLGITPAIMAAKDTDFEVIPGVELTAELDEGEVHILGYFVDWQKDSFVKKLEEISEVRSERAKKILERLKEHDINIKEEELFKLSGRGSVGRLHIAHLLVKKGAVSSIFGAFKDYIGENGPCYVKKFKLSPKEAVDMIKGAGGVAVLAHPVTINIKDKSREDVIKSLIEQGIEGLEVYYSVQTRKDQNEFKEIAEKYNLFATGGSDCHGFGKKSIFIGRVKVPYELVEKMRKSLHR